MNPVELVMRRRNVAAFINADPVDVVLTRRSAPIRTPAGGLVSAPDPVPLAPQRVRIVQNIRRFNPGLANTEAGTIGDYDFLVIGLHTLDIAENDTFQLDGKWWIVTGIHPTRIESILAMIRFRGEGNPDG